MAWDKIPWSELRLDSKDRIPLEQAYVLAQPGNMQGLYLGSCLESCRWGGPSSVMWELSTLDMLAFIENWMRQNPDDFPEMFFHPEMECAKVLPYKKGEKPNYGKCPRDKTHKGTVKDHAGRLRCSHKTQDEPRKPGYIIEFLPCFDPFSQTQKIEYANMRPSEHDDSGWARFEATERSVVINDICYAIIPEQLPILSLEEVLKRVNLCVTHGVAPKLRTPDNSFITPFDGWSLAAYVKAWYEQFDEEQVLLLKEEVA